MDPDISDMTEFIAMLAGPYLLVTGIGFLVSPAFYEKAVAGGEDADRVALNLSGAVHFLVGLLILVQHFRWGGPAEAVVTLVGVGALLKGAALIVVPELTLKSPKASRAGLRVSAAAFLLVGGYLAYVGFAA